MTHTNDNQVGPVSVPMMYQEFWDAWEDARQRQVYLDAYATGQHSFVPNVLPEHMLHLTGPETLDILRQRWGAAVDLALTSAYTDPEHLSVALPLALHSPVATQPDGRWLQQTNMVGINVRTVGSFWNIVKYALTLPAAQNAIHILPIWEPGVAGSIYGMSSWQLNQEFASDELAGMYPTLDTVGKQLRAVIHLLHMQGKAVGLDVIPHTERFAEMVLAFPEHFEWLQRQDAVIVDHSADLHEQVQGKIINFLNAHGPALPDEASPATPAALFGSEIGEAQRNRMLFGAPGDPLGRRTRRNLLIRYLYRYGLEPVPATMAPPFRGLHVDPRPETKSMDANGMIWREYAITRPTSMSRVFGPLTRYKLYEPLASDDWALDFDRPRPAVWQYVCGKYAAIQQQYGFDFMRGDMSHVQMRPNGVPAVLDPFYDILCAVKRTIQEHDVPYFGYFAETFVAPRDIMGYGEEIDHLEAADADATLGDLQSTVVGAPEFLQRFRYYDDLRRTRLCAPSFTMMTADKDDPRFDGFYRHGSAVRLFIAMFLSDMPSYMGLGFETRDVHDQPAPNEHYTKLFVFQETGGPKATHGPYVWGKNSVLYHTLTRMKLYLDSIWPTLGGRVCRWLIPPTATATNAVIAWTQADAPDYVFVANTDGAQAAERFALPQFGVDCTLHCEFSTVSTVPDGDQHLVSNSKHYKLTRLAPDEARVYCVRRAGEDA